MSKLDVDALAGVCARPGGPAVIEAEGLSAEQAGRLSAALAAQGVQARVLDGARLSGKAELLRAVAAAFAFPSYFGHNWDALVDCWSDMSWLPAKGYVCVFLHADAFRASDPDAHDTFLQVCGDVAERWRGADPAVVFKLVRGSAPAPGPKGARG
jgi:RNAse (barnase) inhibitor barstar